MLIVVWYDLSLEDELLRNMSLIDSERVIIDGLITKRAKPRFFLRKAMFLRKSWSINKRVRKCLVIYFSSSIHFYMMVVLYFTLFD